MSFKAAIEETIESTAGRHKSGVFKESNNA